MTQNIMTNQSNNEILLSTGAFVYDCNMVPQALGDFVNSGGEGNIYRLESNPNILVKIYKTFKHANKQKSKIIAMKQMKSLRSNRKLAWPQLDIYNENGDFIGFAMGGKNGFSLNQIGIPMLVKEKLPNWNRKDLVMAALNFLSLVKELHANNIVIGDVNPGNFLINPGTAEISFIDCDSYQVKTNTESFFCEVGMQQFMAPEFLDKDMKITLRTKEHDVFSVAMMIYRIFMFGAHPYSRINGQDPVSNLKSGQCPLGTGSNCQFPRGSWYNYWSHLPFKMKSTFIKMFRDGHGNPSARPSINEMQAVLEEYSIGLQKGFHCLEMMPNYPKSSTYNGRFSQKT